MFHFIKVKKESGDKVTSLTSEKERLAAELAGTNILVDEKV